MSHSESNTSPKLPNDFESDGEAENSTELSGANQAGFEPCGNKGVVKWFNDAKGFGFIQHENGKDVFVHFSTICTDGFKTLKDGEEVEYEFHEGPKGLQATRVLRVNPPETEQTTPETEASNDSEEETSEN